MTMAWWRSRSSRAVGRRDRRTPRAIRQSRRSEVMIMALFSYRAFDELEEQVAAAGRDGQIADPVNHQERGATDARCAREACRRARPGERCDEVAKSRTRRCGRPYGLDGQGGGQVAFAGAGRSEEKNGRRSQIHRKKPPRKPMPNHTARANGAKSKVRAAVEHVFAHEKGPMGLVVRTIGLARARVKIGLANLVYNMKRTIWLTGRLAPA